MNLQNIPQNIWKIIGGIVTLIAVAFLGIILERLYYSKVGVDIWGFKLPAAQSVVDMPKIQVLDSKDKPYQRSSEAEAVVSFEFDFDVKHAWVELVDNIQSADGVSVGIPSGKSSVVEVTVKTAVGPGNSGKARFRVWATNY